MLSRKGALVDWLWRIGFRLAHAARLGYWFAFRPASQGVYVGLWVGGRVLVIKNSYRRAYTLPCGGVKAGEDLATAAARELREEVGVEVARESLKVVGEFLSREYYFYDQATVFELELESVPEITVDRREVVWAEFLPAEEIRKLMLSSIARQYLTRRFS